MVASGSAAFAPTKSWLVPIVGWTLSGMIIPSRHALRGLPDLMKSRDWSLTI